MTRTCASFNLFSLFRGLGLAVIAVGSLLGIGWVGSAEGDVIFTVDIFPTSVTTVGPGGTISYQMTGELSGDQSLGLALWGIDLRSSYAIPGGLPQLSPGASMNSFVMPDGITNPAGYGGTPVGDDLLRQIGGGQNTFGNPGPNPPMGTVVLGIGLSPVVLATGQANLPNVPGTYRLEISDLFANVISGPGVGDPPVFPVDAAQSAIGLSSFDVVVVPEPDALMLLVIGGLVLIWRQRHKAS